MRRILCLFFLSVLLAACATQQSPAPIVERDIPSVGAASAVSSSETVPVTTGRRSSDRRPASYTVKRGDTLYRIAFDFGLSYRELASWNGVENPDDIKVGQALRLIPPAETGDGVEVRPLADAPVKVVSSPVASAPVVAAPQQQPTLAYPKAVTLPYSAKNVSRVGKLADGDAIRPVSAKASPVVAVAVSPAISPAAAREKKPVADAGVTRGVPVATKQQSESKKLAWVAPTSGKLLKSFSEDSKGIDFGGKIGQSVVASAGGKVVYAGGGLRGYGNMVIIKHNNAYLSAYAHNSKLLVKEGDVVKKGEKIAEMGNTDTDHVKLHFEVRKFGKPVDPTKFITVDRP